MPPKFHNFEEKVKRKFLTLSKVKTYSDSKLEPESVTIYRLRLRLRPRAKLTTPFVSDSDSDSNSAALQYNCSFMFCS